MPMLSDVAPLFDILLFLRVLPVDPLERWMPIKLSKRVGNKLVSSRVSKVDATFITCELVILFSIVFSFVFLN
jgi:hypothetical protein